MPAYTSFISKATKSLEAYKLHDREVSSRSEIQSKLIKQYVSSI
jgi:hypothetical protein